MGYFEAIKAGLIAGKWLILIIAVIWLFWFVYHKGELNERLKWELSTKEHALQVQKALQDATTKTMQETEKSNAYATFINEEYNAKVNELHATSVKLDSLRADKICRGRSTSTLPKNNDSGVHDEAAADDELSQEFQEFLLSEFRRGDEVGIYANFAHKWVLELCKSESVICPKLENSP